MDDVFQNFTDSPVWNMAALVGTIILSIVGNLATDWIKALAAKTKGKAKEKEQIEKMMIEVGKKDQVIFYRYSLIQTRYFITSHILLGISLVISLFIIGLVALPVKEESHNSLSIVLFFLYLMVINCTYIAIWYFRKSTKYLRMIKEMESEVIDKRIGNFLRRKIDKLKKS